MPSHVYVPVSRCYRSSLTLLITGLRSHVHPLKSKRCFHSSQCRNQLNPLPLFHVDKFTLKDDGLASFPSLVPSQLVRPLLQVVSEDFLKQKGSFDLHLLRATNNVYSSKNRYSIPLAWSKEAENVLKNVLKHVRKDASQALGVHGLGLGELLQGIAGLDGELVELSAIISLPGAAAQDNHSDLSYTEGTVYRNRILDNPDLNQYSDSGKEREQNPLLCSVFVALQDVETDMGATKIFPRTHTWDFHSRVKKTSYTYSPDGNLEPDQHDIFSYDSFGNVNQVRDNFGGLYDESNYVSMTVKEGSAYIIDSRVVHAGGANSSLLPRYLLCFAFQRRDKRTGFAARADGFTYHLLPSVKSLNLSLKHFI